MRRCGGPGRQRDCVALSGQSKDNRTTRSVGFGFEARSAARRSLDHEQVGYGYSMAGEPFGHDAAVAGGWISLEAEETDRPSLREFGEFVQRCLRRPRRQDFIAVDPMHGSGVTGPRGLPSCLGCPEIDEVAIINAATLEVLTEDVLRKATLARQCDGPDVSHNRHAGILKGGQEALGVSALVADCE